MKRIKLSIVSFLIILVIALPIYVSNVSNSQRIDTDFKEALTCVHGGFSKGYNDMDTKEVAIDYADAISGIGAANSLVNYTSYAKENTYLVEALSLLNSYMIENSPLIEPISNEINGNIFDRIVGIALSPNSEERSKALINYIESLNDN